jgi:hypothetical protein
VDLNPTGFDDTTGLGTNGSTQIGYGYGPVTGGAFNYHTLAWSGTAASAIDLNTELPSTDTWTSIPFSIDTAGNIYGTATNSSSQSYAVVWVPVPEPTVTVPLGLGFVLFTRRRKPSQNP